jgi:uridine kinase
MVVWDFSIFLDVPFAETARRKATRDGTNADPDHRRWRDTPRDIACFPACEPASMATLVIDECSHVSRFRSSHR